MFSPINVIGIEIIPGLLIVQGVIFLVVLWFLNQLLFKPILAILQEREKRTEGFFGEADEIKKQADQLLKQYQERVREAKKGVMEIKRNIVLEGVEQKELLLGNAKKEAQQFLEEMRKNIGEEIQHTKKQLYHQLDEIAKLMAERALGRSVE